MANRNWISGGKIYSMDSVQPVMINCSITIGAAGANTAEVGPMIGSVDHAATGIYDIFLTDNFNQLLSAQGSMQSPSVGLSGISAIEIQNAPNAAVQSSSAPKLRIKCLDATGALADPANGSVINVMMLLSNSSVSVG